MGTIHTQCFTRFFKVNFIYVAKYDIKIICYHIPQMLIYNLIENTFSFGIN